MKKTILFLALSLASVLTMAAPALRGPFVVTQPDGTLLTIEQYGDEHYHWTTTTDGTMVVNTGHGYFLAQIDDEGKLTATNVLAHEAEQRTSEELILVEKQSTRHALFHQRGERRAAASRRSMSIGDSYKYLPHKGNVRVLTILAAFSDLDFSVNEPAKAFDQLLNSDTQENLDNENDLNIASVRKYFETASQGAFSPQFDVVGPVTLPNTMEYYGGTATDGSDDKFGAFCLDAITKAKEAELVSDWKVYDNDGDGTVELVCIIFAGYGQNQGGADNTIWAKASNRNLKVDGLPTISFFNCSCEKFHPQRPTYINGTGVFIHEMSHCMGLPDLYPTTTAGRKVNNQSMESYDIMDYGCYNRNSFAPSLYTAWEQEAMGWTTIEALTEATQVSNVKSLEEGGKAYKIVNPSNEREYIVLENIQKQGINSHAYGHGLLAYRVNYPSNTVNMFDYPNNTAGNPGVAIVPADGLMISGYQTERYKEYYGGSYTNAAYRASLAGDPFPGTETVTNLSDDMKLPNFCFYQSSSQVPVGHYLYYVTEDTKGGTISFFYDKKELVPVDDDKKTVVDVTKLADETLADNYVDNVYYNLGEESGYDTGQQCLVLGQTTDMSTISTPEPSSDEMKSHYTGIILQLTKGSGTITVHAQVLGNTALAVKIGSNDPTLATPSEQSEVKVNYDVEEDTYLYIYSVPNTVAGPQFNRSIASDNLVRIFELEVTPSGVIDGIREVRQTSETILRSDDALYNLNGQRVSQPTRGLYIRNGKKYLLK